MKNAIWRGGAGTPVRLVARRLRGRAHRDAHALGHRAAARRVAVDADARQLPAREEGGDGAALAHHQPVPARLLRPGGVRARRPRGEARAAARDELGLRVGHQHAARAAAGAPAAQPARAAPSRSSWSPTASPPPTSRAARPTSSTRRRRSPSRRRSRRSCAARVTASASTPSCSTRATTCASFVEQMMRVNGGRAFFTNADTLGDYVLVDFLEQRRVSASRRLSAPRYAGAVSAISRLVALVDGGVEAHEAHELHAGDRGAHGRRPRSWWPRRRDSRRRRC